MVWILTSLRLRVSSLAFIGLRSSEFFGLQLQVGSCPKTPRMNITPNIVPLNHGGNFIDRVTRGWGQHFEGEGIRGFIYFQRELYVSKSSTPPINSPHYPGKKKHSFT